MKYLIKIGISLAIVFTILMLPTAVQRCVSAPSPHLPIMKYSKVSSVCPMAQDGLSFLLAHINLIKGVLVASISAGALLFFVLRIRTFSFWYRRFFQTEPDKNLLNIRRHFLFSYHPLRLFMTKRTFAPKAP